MPATNPAVTGLLAIVSTAVLLMTCAADVATGWQIDTSTPAIGRPKAFTTGELVLPSVPDWACAIAGAQRQKSRKVIVRRRLSNRKRRLRAKVILAANVHQQDELRGVKQVIRSFRASKKPSRPFFGLKKCRARSFICVSILQIDHAQLVRTASARFPDFDAPAPRVTRLGGARPKLAALP